MQPFAALPYVPRSADELIEVAFRRASRVSVKGGVRGLARIRRMEERRIREVGRYLQKRLREICFGYPRLDDVHPFL